MTYGLKLPKYAVLIGRGVVFVYTMADFCNDVIDEFLEDMGNLTDNFDDLSIRGVIMNCEPKIAEPKRVVLFHFIVHGKIF